MLTALSVHCIFVGNRLLHSALHFYSERISPLNIWGEGKEEHIPYNRVIIMWTVYPFHATRILLLFVSNMYM